MGLQGALLQSLLLPLLLPCVLMGPLLAFAGSCSQSPPLCCLGRNDTCHRHGCYCDEYCLTRTITDCCKDYTASCGSGRSTAAWSTAAYSTTPLMISVKTSGLPTTVTTLMTSTLHKATTETPKAGTLVVSTSIPPNKGHGSGSTWSVPSSGAGQMLTKEKAAPTSNGATINSGIKNGTTSTMANSKGTSTTKSNENINTENITLSVNATTRKDNTTATAQNSTEHSLGSSSSESTTSTVEKSSLGNLASSKDPGTSAKEVTPTQGSQSSSKTHLSNQHTTDMIYTSSRIFINNSVSPISPITDTDTKTSVRTPAKPEGTTHTTSQANTSQQQTSKSTKGLTAITGSSPITSINTIIQMSSSSKPEGTTNTHTDTTTFIHPSPKVSFTVQGSSLLMQSTLEAVKQATSLTSGNTSSKPWTSNLYIQSTTYGVNTILSSLMMNPTTVNKIKSMTPAQTSKSLADSTVSESRPTSTVISPSQSQATSGDLVSLHTSGRTRTSIFYIAQTTTKTLVSTKTSDSSLTKEDSKYTVLQTSSEATVSINSSGSTIVIPINNTSQQTRVDSKLYPKTSNSTTAEFSTPTQQQDTSEGVESLMTSAVKTTIVYVSSELPTSKSLQSTTTKQPITSTNITPSTEGLTNNTSAGILPRAEVTASATMERTDIFVSRRASKSATATVDSTTPTTQTRSDSIRNNTTQCTATSADKKTTFQRMSSENHLTSMKSQQTTTRAVNALTGSTASDCTTMTRGSLNETMQSTTTAGTTSRVVVSPTLGTGNTRLYLSLGISTSLNLAEVGVKEKILQKLKQLMAEQFSDSNMTLTWKGEQIRKTSR